MLLTIPSSVQFAAMAKAMGDAEAHLEVTARAGVEPSLPVRHVGPVPQPTRHERRALAVIYARETKKAKQRISRWFARLEKRARPVDGG